MRETHSLAIGKLQWYDDCLRRRAGASARYVLMASPFAAKEFVVRRSEFGNLLKKRSALLSLLAVLPFVAVILGLAACVKHPVGDPEKSKVDPQYAGVWLKQDEGERLLLFIQPYDARTYFVTSFEYENNDGQPEPKGETRFKAWLTLIGDSTFMTLQVLSYSHFAGIDEKPPYFVAKLSLKEGSLQWRLVDGDNQPIKSAQDSRELEEAIRKNIGSDDLYMDAMQWKKCNDKALVESVLKAFRCGD